MLTVGVLTFADYMAALIWGDGATFVMVKSIGASVIGMYNYVFNCI